MISRRGRGRGKGGGGPNLLLVATKTQVHELNKEKRELHKEEEASLAFGRIRLGAKSISKSLCYPFYRNPYVECHLNKKRFLYLFAIQQLLYMLCTLWRAILALYL
jgi:hypothetical protein